MQEARDIMSQKSKIRLGAIPRSTMRLMRNTPTYFFLVWRWTWWAYALALLTLNPKHPWFVYLVLGTTLIQTLIVTLYSPVFKLLLPGKPTNETSATGRSRLWRRWLRRRSRILGAGDDLEALPPLARSTNVYKNIALYGLDVLICGLATYFTAIYNTPFGGGSPFYRYGFSTVFVAAFVFRYRGGLAAALGYDLFILLGVFIHPPLSVANYSLQAGDLLGSIFDAPLIAIFVAYLSTLLNSYTSNKRLLQDSARRQKALTRLSDRLLQGTSDRQQFLRQYLEEIRKGGHFARLVVALINQADSPQSLQSPPSIETVLESGITGATASDDSETIALQVAHDNKKYKSFEPISGDAYEQGEQLARLYLPLKSMQGDQVCMVIGGERVSAAPFEERQERFLQIAGAQLVIALENIRLAELAAELTAVAERGRIAREMHDGVAQLIYMLSLNTETCVALVQRLSETLDEEEAQSLAPVAARLEKLVTLSKQALWETRHYMFTLKPLIQGDTTLTQMLSNQLHEFESISGLPVQFEVDGEESLPNGNQKLAHRQAQVGTAIFRITQEALTNAYKHANATHLHVLLRHQSDLVEVDISDDGKGMPINVTAPGTHEDERRFYSGHGIRGMRERAEELGGTCEISQRPLGGVSVLARIPLS
jgi:signal transduction histidine kinase